MTKNGVPAYFPIAASETGASSPSPVIGLLYRPEYAVVSARGTVETSSYENFGGIYMHDKEKKVNKVITISTLIQTLDTVAASETTYCWNAPRVFL